MAKRKKRAATKRSTRKKKTAHDGQATYRYQAPDKCRTSDRCEAATVRYACKCCQTQTAPETRRGTYLNRGTGNHAGRGAGRIATAGRYKPLTRLSSSERGHCESSRSILFPFPNWNAICGYCASSLERRSRSQPFAFRSAETGPCKLGLPGWRW